MLVWNLVEAGVALWAGVQAGSVALLAFSLDSIVELFAGGVLVARLRQEREGVEDEAAERRAQRLLGISFFLLAAYIALHSGASILGWLPEPQPSLAGPGVGIVVASAVVMGGLYVGKMRVAARMQSRSLRAEAMESLFCDMQGPDHLDRTGVQRFVFLVVGRPGVGIVLDSLPGQGGQGELFGS